MSRLYHTDNAMPRKKEPLWVTLTRYVVRMELSRDLYELPKAVWVRLLVTALDAEGYALSTTQVPEYVENMIETAVADEIATIRRERKRGRDAECG